MKTVFTGKSGFVIIIKNRHKKEDAMIKVENLTFSYSKKPFIRDMNVGLQNDAQKRVSEYSKGMKSRLMKDMILAVVNAKRKINGLFCFYSSKRGIVV